MTAVGSIEKAHRRRRTRRGRLSTSPRWCITTLTGERWQFRRRKDAAAFVEAGCVCPDHEDYGCPRCNGRKLTIRQQLRAAELLDDDGVWVDTGVPTRKP